MAKTEAMHKPSNNYDCEASLAISHVTDDVKHILKGLLGVSSVIEWDRQLNGALKDLHL